MFPRLEWGVELTIPRAAAILDAGHWHTVPQPGGALGTGILPICHLTYRIEFDLRLLKGIITGKLSTLSTRIDAIDPVPLDPAIAVETQRPVGDAFPQVQRGEDAESGVVVTRPQVEQPGAEQNPHIMLIVSLCPFFLKNL